MRIIKLTKIMSLLIIGEEILENEDRAPIRLGNANKAFCLTAKKIRGYMNRKARKNGISF
jgi:hypothetical protein